MKITIRSDEINMTIPIPNFLIDSAMTRSIIKNGIEQSGHEISIDPHTIDVFLKELARVAKQHKGLVILEAESSSGELVKVVL